MNSSLYSSVKKENVKRTVSSSSPSHSSHPTFTTRISSTNFLFNQPTSTSTTFPILDFELHRAPTLTLPPDPIPSPFHRIVNLFSTISLWWPCICIFIAIFIGYFRELWPTTTSLHHLIQQRLLLTNQSTHQLLSQLETSISILNNQCDLDSKRNSNQYYHILNDSNKLCTWSLSPNTNISILAIKGCSLTMALLRSDIQRIDLGEVDVDLLGMIWKINQIKSDIIIRLKEVKSYYHTINDDISIILSSKPTINWYLIANDKLNHYYHYIHDMIHNTHDQLFRTKTEIYLFINSIGYVINQLRSITHTVPCLTSIIHEIIGKDDNKSITKSSFRSNYLTELTDFSLTCHSRLQSSVTNLTSSLEISY